MSTRFATRRHESRYPNTLVTCDTLALDRTSFHFKLGWIDGPFGHLERTPKSRRSGGGHRLPVAISRHALESPRPRATRESSHCGRGGAGRMMKAKPRVVFQQTRDGLLGRTIKVRSQTQEDVTRF